MFAADSQMNIDGCGFQRFMTKQSFYGHKVNTIFVEMRSKSMPERMTGNAFWPFEFWLVFCDMSGKISLYGR